MPPFLRPLLATLLALAAAPALAQFSVHVTPPRFEDSAAPGSTYRNIIEITNISAREARLKMASADWRLNDEGAVEFSNSLYPGSCRPWVGIEAPEIVVEANGKRRYRFEVAVPADAPDGQCRFAIMIEGEPEVVKGDLALPVAGRIGVIVYLNIGKGAAALEITGAGSADVQGRRLPVLQVRNGGNAHGRLEGFIDGTDAAGNTITFSPANSPILPGVTRAIALFPVGEDPDAPPPAISFPVRIEGRLDWGSQRLDINTTAGR